MKSKIRCLVPIEDTFSIVDIVEKSIPSTWYGAFQQAIDELKDISEIVADQEKKNGRIYPNKQNIFRAFELTPLKQVKVVIFGQDPYHTTNDYGEPIASGLAFSVSRREKVPPSLNNIYKELESCLPEFKRPNHGDLTAWAKQGVLLCNTALTVNPGQPGSHGQIWHGFIRHIIEAIVETNRHCIYVLWGKHAQSLESLIGSRGIILTAAHPSGYSANKGFFGCQHFKLINEKLESLGSHPINWSLD